MANELGTLIADEVGRAETDLAAMKSRGQAVLTVSGALVTLVAGVVALAVGKDAKLLSSPLTMGATALALGAFVIATVLVLLMLWPSSVEAVSSKDVAKFATDNWDDDGWEQQVAIALGAYLRSLRVANGKLTRLLRWAVCAEVVGIASAAVMAFSLLIQAG